MFISIIIPSYGREDLLNTCIQKIRESAYGDYEIIVVDDSSRPPLGVIDPDVRMIVSKNNMGPGGARNLGANKARGDVLLFVDSDVILSRNAYHEILETLKTHDFDAVYGIYSLDFPYANFCSKYKNLYWNFNQMHLDPTSYNICTAIFSIRKDVFEEIGGFNSRSLVGEDRELGLKLKEKNKRIFLNKKVQVVHYKKFNFLQLLKHHLQNSVAYALLFLKIKLARSLQYGEGLVERNKIICMLLPPIIAVLSLVTLFTFNPVFLIVDVIALVIFLYLTADFLKYSHKLASLKFSFFVFWMYLLEEIIASIGISLGIFRFFLFRRRELNFKIGA